MASEGSTQALIKRRNDELALMPPPPPKRIKRPSEVLDEDDYTDALSDIIARDYFPGLREVKAQEEYLSALDSKNPEWIQEAARKLQAATNGEVEVKKIKRGTRNTSFDTPRSYRQAAETPKNLTGADTPISIADTELQNNNEEPNAKQNQPDTSTLSLSSYQSKYTSEDNASFNTLLDKQNNTRRQKHSYLWTPTQRLLTTHQLEHRKTQQKLLTDSTSPASTTNALTTGATPTLDEQNLQTTMDLKETLSKAGPKEIIHANTRFPPSGPRFSATDGENDNDEDDTTSIHTSFIARRINRPSTTATDITTETNGSETPRVNGYSFVDEDAPTATPLFPPITLPPTTTTTTTPNPFHLTPTLPRETLHRKLVEQDAEKKRAKQKELVKGKGKGDGKDAGNMTPAARKLLGRLGGRTPVGTGTRTGAEGEGDVGGRREDWTPGVTPRRERVRVGAMGR